MAVNLCTFINIKNIYIKNIIGCIAVVCYHLLVHLTVVCMCIQLRLQNISGTLHLRVTVVQNCTWT